MSANPKQVYDTLLSVRVWLDDPKHWCKGRYGSFDVGQTCLSGAISGCARYAARDVLLDILRIDDPRADLSGFNDRPPTTHRDILNLLDTALDVLEDELGVTA